MKIKYKLTGAFLVIALMIAVVGFLAVRKSQSALQRSIEQNSVTVSQHVLEDVDKQVLRRIEETQAYCRDLLFQKAIKESNEKFERLSDPQKFMTEKNKEWTAAPRNSVTPFMKEIMEEEASEELGEKTNYYEEKYGYKVFGNLIVTNKYGAVAGMIKRAAEYRQDKKEWWIKAKERGLYIGEIGYNEDAGMYAINFSVRVDDEKGNFLGVANAVLNMEDLSGVVKELERDTNLKETGTSFKLITKSKKVIYATGKFNLLQDASAFLKKEPAPEHPAVYSFTDSSKGAILAIALRSGFEALGFIFIVEHQTDKIFSPVEKLKNSILITSLLVTVIAIAMGMFCSASIAKPVIALRDAAQEIGKGNLNAAIDTNSSDEIGELAGSFAKMAEDLGKTTVKKTHLNNIITTMVDSLIVTAPDGKINMINEATSELLGYTGVELIGQSLVKIFGDENGAKSLLELLLKKQDTETKPLVDVEKTYVSKKGKKIPVLFSASVMYDNENNPEGLVCIALDITERKRAEEKLKLSTEEVKEANEELRSFAYIISHDLRAPLVNIRGFSQELMAGVKESQNIIEKYLPQLEKMDQDTLSTVFKTDIPEALAFISSSIQRMDKQISSILNLSRIGRRELKPEMVDTRNVVESILKTLTHQLETHKTNVTVGDLPEIFIDKTAIEQVFGNLLDNAVKYFDSEREGKIDISAEMGDEAITFQVKDNGRGIAQDDMHKVFEIFRRAGKQDKPGEGMGLAYVRTLIKRHGGRIWCESEFGKGTTFKFTVPVDTSVAKAA